MKPKVSVLIPTYRYARYLPESIESILNQSMTDFELIISDDDSKDGSEEIIRRYAEQDERIRFKIQSPNLGMVRNWNWCLEQAQGKYIKYVFGDDYLISRDAIARYVELMESDPSVRLASSARTIVDKLSNPIEVWDFVDEEGVNPGLEIVSSCLRRDHNLIGEPTAVMFRREDAQRGFDASFKQIVDWEFWLHLLLGGDLAYSKTPLCAFRRHPLQQTAINKLTIDGRQEHIRLMKLYSRYFSLRPEHTREIFDHLYYLRKKRELEPYDRELMDVFSIAIGRAYYFYWVRRKAMRPFENARRSWRKHVLHDIPDQKTQSDALLFPGRDRRGAP